MSEWVIEFILISVLPVLISFIIYFIVRRLVHVNTLQKHHDLVGFIITTLGTLYSVFLGFTIVNSQDRQSKIIAKVDKEAYLGADLYRLARNFPEKDKKEMQKGVLGYLNSVVKDEWPLMNKKMESPITLEKLEEMWKPYDTFTPRTTLENIWYKKSIDILSKFNSARLERIYSSWESLGPISWIALILGALIISSFLFFFGTENTKVHLSINALFVGYIAFMLFVIYVFDNPFKSPRGIKPTAYQVILNYYEKANGQSISPESNVNFGN